MAYGKVDKEPDKDDLEGLRHLTFHETEGGRDIQEGPFTDALHLLPLKLWKNNIGTEDKPKLAPIKYY